MPFAVQTENKNTSDIKPLIAQANSLIQNGQIAEGHTVFNLILEKDPSNIIALSGRGVAESLLGNPAAAIETLKAAHLLAPHEIRILLNLANAYMATGSGQDALDHFEKAYALNNTNAEASYWLGFLNEKKGNLPEAINFYEQTIELEPDNRQAYFQLADTLFVQDRKLDAFLTLRKAETIFKGDSSIQYLKGQLLSKSVPGWHLPMLHDKPRNDAYEKAINAIVTKDDIVLDIGTGSGLLAMMAARAGAKHVYACEMNPILAAMAHEVIAANNLQDKITIIEKKSSDMIIGEDMPEKADVLVMEIFDSAVVGEEVLPTMQHAWAALLKDGARIIPESAQLHGALTQCPDLEKLNQIGEVNGFDLSAMEHFARPFSHWDMQVNFAASDECKRLSEPFFIQNYDFQKPPEMEFATEVSTKISTDGNADSMIFWFDLTMADGITFSTEDYQTQNHWRPASQILMDHETCEAGENKKVQIQFFDCFEMRVLPDD